MFSELFSNILAIPKEAFAGQIVNNQLNPLHLAVATSGYRMQSRTLRVPDRFGFFSPVPPHLQVHEGLFFIVMVGWICLNLISNAFSVFLRVLTGLPTCRKLGVAFSLTIVPGVILLWIAAVYDRRRKPGYMWEDWKLPEE